MQIHLTDRMEAVVSGEVCVLNFDNRTIKSIEVSLNATYRVTKYSSVTELEQSLLSTSENTRVVLAKVSDSHPFSEELLNQPSIMEQIPFLCFVPNACLDTTRRLFQSGAKDVLIGPINANELIFRLERVIIHDGLVIKNYLQLIERFGTELTLTELKIICQFWSNPDKSITRDALLKNIWKEIKVHPKTIDVHLFNLRKKLQKVNAKIVFDPKNQKWHLQ